MSPCTLFLSSLISFSASSSLLLNPSSIFYSLVIVFFFFSVFLGLHPRHMKFPRGPVGATAAGLCHGYSNMGSEPCLWPTPQLTAMLDPYPLSKARDWTCILMDASEIRFHWATTGTPVILFFSPVNSVWNFLIFPLCRNEHSLCSFRELLYDHYFKYFIRKVTFLFH